MLTFPNCKINLGLYVTRKRADGYHDIETVFYPVQYRDVLEVVRGDLRLRVQVLAFAPRRLSAPQVGLGGAVPLAPVTAAPTGAAPGSETSSAMTGVRAALAAAPAFAIDGSSTRDARAEEIDRPAVEVHAVDEVLLAAGRFAEVFAGRIVGITDRAFAVAVIDRILTPDIALADMNALIFREVAQVVG